MPRVSHRPVAAAAGDGCGDVSGTEIEDGLVVVVGAAAEGELLGGGLAAESPGENVVELESGGGAAAAAIGGLEGAAVAVALPHLAHDGASWAATAGRSFDSGVGGRALRRNMFRNMQRGVRRGRRRGRRGGVLRGLGTGLVLLGLGPGRGGRGPGRGLGSPELRVLAGLEAFGVFRGALARR